MTEPKRALKPGRRRQALIGAFVVATLVLPAVANSYVLSIATLALYLAYVGQAWNVMMGFAGQLSLGHTLYVGLGAYAAAGLFFHYGVGPWAGVWLAIALCSGAGAFIGFLAFRLRVAGVQLSLLTIAFAELARIGFDHLEWLGGPGGLFLRVSERSRIDLLGLRGPPAMYYYVILGLVAAALGLCAFLLRRRAGYYWRAIREDEAAAQSLGIDVFGWKMRAVVLSAAMTAVAGVFFAFYYNSLFPEQIFGFGRSIEIILGPVVGGVGTLFGPIVGAVALVLLGDGTTEALTRLGFDLPGAKQVIYGLLLLLVTIYMPNGLWPPLARALGFASREDELRSSERIAGGSEPVRGFRE
jgi:branched-chain amino acid transport system permease protein